MTPVVERLASVLSGVNDWLKHAEAKNGVLVAANGAALLALLSAGLQKQIGGFWTRLYLLELAALLLLGLVVALSAFLPVIKPREPEDRRPFSPAGNLLYFGDIAGTDPASYLAAVCEACLAEGNQSDRMAMSYARQIVVNSEIGRAKYQRFTAAAWLTLVGVATPPVVILYLVVVAVSRRGRKAHRTWRGRRAARPTVSPAPHKSGPTGPGPTASTVADAPASRDLQPATMDAPATAPERRGARRRGRE